jgi:DNA (cytosine-5)-methyltransferase 1
MRTIHLFAGAGGGLLADLILGHEPVCAVEWDAYCCAVLRERAADGWFPGLHVHEGDVRLFDPSPWAGRVDCIHAGFPCQDISAAGRGAGISAGARSGLWREVVRVADHLRPEWIMLENSPRITRRGIEVVVGCLATLGYDARWDVLGAADVGADHDRYRWWCLCRRAAGGERPGRQAADADRAGVQRQRSVSSSAEGEAWARERDALCLVAPAARADSDGIGGEAGWPVRQRIADARVGGWWEVEPDVGRVADGLAPRVDRRRSRVKALGNGQVPLCAATAWRLLGGP